MDEAELLLRIRVVVGSTRAAARSLGGDGEQLTDVLNRGRGLLDAMASGVERNGSQAVRERFAEAWEELEAIGADLQSEGEGA